MKYQHLVFYDGECGLCDRAVQWILTKDVEEQFCFAPLQGETATRLLNDDVKKVDSLVLIEFYKTDPKIFLEGDAMLTICASLPISLLHVSHLQAATGMLLQFRLPLGS